MKHIYLIFIAVIVTFYACQPSRPIKTVTTFTEAIDPAPDSLADWTQVPQGLQLSFGSTDLLYPKSSIPTIGNNLLWKGHAWRGERVYAQLVLWSESDVQQIELAFSDFQSKTASLKSDIAQAQFVRYVLTDIFEPGCGHRKPADFPSSLSPDMLDTLDCFHLGAKTSRPVWISINIPANAEAGIYKSTLSVFANNQKEQTLSIEIEVQPQTLPEAKDWKFHLDLWQHPSAIARVEGVELWSEQHWTAIASCMRTLANAGQKVITATVNKDPWNVQTEDAYADMIRWTKGTDGQWAYDYTIFDRWVKLMMDLGVNKQINCYSLVPWNNELHYFDASTAAYVDVVAKPGTKEFKEMWTPFLINFVQHLKDKNWLQITNIAMDERSPAEMKLTLAYLKATAPELGIALADNHKSYKEYPYLKDISIGFGSGFDAADLQYRKDKHLVSTYYVCCSDKFPNVFTFSQPAEATYMAWYATAAGLDGVLRWAYNSWTKDPNIDSRFRTWPAGDTYIVYPGNRSSIRFERLRGGIQDAEKIRILRAQFTESGNQTKLDQLNAILSVFNTSEVPTRPCYELINEARMQLFQLSNNKQ